MTDELHVLLEWLGRSRFLLHQFRVDQHGPDVVAAVRDHGGIADVLILWDENVACAHRTPTGSGIDVFAPRATYWSYAAGPVWVLRALITLPPPGHPDAPTTLTEAPPGYGIPAEGRTPVRIRRRG